MWAERSSLRAKWPNGHHRQDLVQIQIWDYSLDCQESAIFYQRSECEYPDSRVEVHEQGRLFRIRSNLFQFSQLPSSGEDLISS